MNDVFDALGDPTRHHIVESLSRHEASATQLASELPVTRQAVSKHLTALKEAGLVCFRRDGVRSSYVLNPAAFAAFRADLQEITELVGLVSGAAGAGEGT